MKVSLPRLSAGLLLLLPFFAAAQSNYLFAPSDYYVGTMADVKIRIMIHNVSGEPEGFLFAEDAGLACWMKGAERKGDSIHLKVYRDETGEFYYSPDVDTAYLKAIFHLRVSENDLSGIATDPAGGNMTPINVPCRQTKCPPLRKYKLRLKTKTYHAWR